MANAIDLAALPTSADPIADEQGWPVGISRHHELAGHANVTVWRGKTDTHEEVSVHVCSGEVSADFRSSAERLAELDQVPGVIRVRAIDSAGEWFVADPILGFAIDLPALGWKLDRKLRFFNALCDVLDQIHQRGIVVSVLATSTLAIDPELRPLLTELGPKAIGLDDRYAAPEVKAGRPFDVRADVYSVGRLLAFALTGTEPKQETSGIPRLDWLSRAPAGLCRIVRRCTTTDATLRYPTIRELKKDLAHYGEIDSVGMALSGAIEHNLSGFSTPPAGDPATRAAEIARAKPTIAPAAPRSANAPVGPRSSRTKLFAGAFAAIAAITIAWTSPFEFASHFWHRRAFDATPPPNRGPALERLVGEGDREFPGTSLAGAELAGQKLMGIRLASADLAKANLEGTDLAGADLSGALLRGARAAGADFTGAQIERAIGLETVSCDDHTHPPAGWRCNAGMLASTSRIDLETGDAPTNNSEPEDK